METSSVCVLGGSGFVGRQICERLAARGIHVRVPTRDRERAKSLLTLPTVDVIAADIHNPLTLRALFAGCDAVINLVGVLHDGRGKRSFRGAHVELARAVVDACRGAGVPRLLHMSAVGADGNGPSAYLRSKGEAEQVVRASGLDFTIFRPSVIFGPDDAFLNLFARLLAVTPVFPLAGASTRFQPVYVNDVADAFVTALSHPDASGASFDLCGPRVYTLRDIVAFAACVTGRSRLIIGLPAPLAYCQALALELLPRPLMSRDNLRSMQVDSLCHCAFPFGIQPAAMEAVAPAWLAEQTPRVRYDDFRSRAGR
jgi:uncharacterized protein YbjT (DUF2867 family)